MTENRKIENRRNGNSTAPRRPQHPFLRFCLEIGVCVVTATADRRSGSWKAIVVAIFQGAWNQGRFSVSGRLRHSLLCCGGRPWRVVSVSLSGFSLSTGQWYVFTFNCRKQICFCKSEPVDVSIWRNVLLP